jgi:hypothetical protein
MRPFNACVAVAALCGLAGLSQAATVDLRPGGVTSGVINGATFLRGDLRSAGTGVIQSFVRISAANQSVVQGYNTSGRPLRFDENNSPTFTRDLQFFQIPTVTIAGVAYKEFLLDINQNAGPPSSWLSLDKVQIYSNALPSLNPTNPSALGALRYDMDAGSDSSVYLDYDLNSGSGQSDMAMYVPVSAFGGISNSTYIYLYSMFGSTFANNDGFEEWAVQTPEVLVVPLPSAAISGGLALAGMFGLGMIRRRAAR